MASSMLIRFGGLVAMVGSVVFALVSLLRPMLNAMLAEAVTLPMFFLLLATVSVAIVSIAALLRGTRHGGLGVVACGVSLVGVVLVFVGVLLGFAGIFVIMLGVLVATGGLVALAILTTGTNTLPWWSGVALVAGGLSFILVFYPLEDSLMGVPWLVVGYAIFRAAGRRTEQPSRVR
jgi:drug/metabolite transporter (DMT)-like permease